MRNDHRYFNMITKASAFQAKYLGTVHSVDLRITVRNRHNRKYQMGCDILEKKTVWCVLIDKREVVHDARVV